MSETLTRQPKIVSLSNLETSTPEEVFNHIAFHLLRQNKKAFFQDSQRCIFRTEEGLKCAAGALISDEEWFANENEFQMANTESWSGLIMEGKVPTTHERLILALQEVHDAHPPEKWYDVLCGVALGLGFYNSILSNWNVPPVAFPPDTGTGLTQGYDYSYKPGNIVLQKVKQGVTIYKGALVGFDRNGFIIPMPTIDVQTRDGVRFAGVAEETVYADLGTESVRVSKTGSFVYDVSGTALNNQQLSAIGYPVYATNDHTVHFHGNLDGGKPSEFDVGTILGFELTSLGNPGVRIRIENHTI